jgi:hypothetical protein
MLVRQALYHLSHTPWDVVIALAIFQIGFHVFAKNQSPTYAFCMARITPGGKRVIWYLLSMGTCDLGIWRGTGL